MSKYKFCMADKTMYITWLKISRKKIEMEVFSQKCVIFI